MTYPTKIISGGQTGADQGALRAAKSLGLQTGGWMTRDYMTEDGPAPHIADEYGLLASNQKEYKYRTKANVRIADGTVWFGTTTSYGYSSTFNAARGYRQWLVNPTAEALRQWCVDHAIKTLNVAGNRESVNPGIGARVESLIAGAFA